MPHENRNGRPGGAADVPDGDLNEPTLRVVVDTLDHLQRRVVQEAVATCRRDHLLQRAEQFESAKHRPGIDWPGEASADDLRELWRRCDARSRALRAAAELAVIR